MYTRFMMYVLRRLSLAAILLSILFLISGCAQAIIHISINPDGSSSVEYQLGLTQNLLALSPGGVNPLQKAADDARKDGFTVTDYQEGSYAGFRAKRLFKPGEKGLRLTDLIKIPELAAGRGPAVESKQPLTVKNELFTSTISLDTELDLTNMGQAIQDQGQVQSREQGQDQS
ncbi:MAG: hypothetical protein HYY09_07520, partial [Firmicutes bacterium]|nr:hypothetical protein [Bacillota bacterium]